MMARMIVLLALIGAGAMLNPGLAGPGHDHDAASTPAGTRPPRFEAHSEAFEVVGVVQGEELAVFVDRFHDNTPVLDAKVEIESGPLKAVGTFHADHGDYSFPSAAFKRPGSYPLQITVTAGNQVDLLAADLVIPDPDAGHDHAEEGSALYRWGAWGAAIALLVITGWGVARRRRVHGVSS